jgi:hypothetical protein
LQGKPAKALNYLESQDCDYASESQVIAAIAKAELDAGRNAEAEAEEKLARLITDGGDFYGYKLVVEVAAWVGKTGLAFEYLDRAGLFRDSDWNINFNSGYASTITDPIFLRLHDDPRWGELRKISGMSARRFDAIRFNSKLLEQPPPDLVE